MHCSLYKEYYTSDELRVKPKKISGLRKPYKQCNVEQGLNEVFDSLTFILKLLTPKFH